jgi:fluoride ion exporter CrcB/FEX
MIKAKAVAYTLIKVGLVGGLAVLSQFEWNVFSMTSRDWKMVLVAVLAAVGVAVWKALDPTDTAYGIGS